MKCLILGGNGFIGSALRENLLSAGQSVITFGLTATPHISSHGRKLAHIQGDFRTYKQWDALLAESNRIFYCISPVGLQSGDFDPEFDLENNCAPLLRLLPAVVKMQTKLVFVSSGGAIYGATAARSVRETHPATPISAYGVGKLCIENYLHFYHHRYGLSYGVARVANAFGERQNLTRGNGAIGVFLLKAIRGESIDIRGDGQLVRDFIYVRDVAEALVRISHYEGPYSIFNVGSGQGRSINEIVRSIEELIGKPMTKVHKPRRPEDISYNVLSTDRICNVLGWYPSTPFDVALARTAEWIRDSVIQAGAELSTRRAQPIKQQEILSQTVA